ncbi:MAG TPA: histidinol dehydrogenase, partial [Bacteroidota bacterium]|nr:histidinol dehydrogenase [Bacteroidota bacterium]
APEVLVAAAECGVSEVYRIGGAQAVGALAYGTATVPAVDKITGPGNAYVAAAKQLVYGRVGIDMIAGPTEVVVIADETADPVFVAADLIAQAEHDQDATPIAIVTCDRLVPEITAQIALQLEQNPRRPIAAEAFDRHGLLIVVPSLRDAAELANTIAPEHLEIMTAKPRRVARTIRHAGAIFVGSWATEALGDYVAGPNHTLPTSGTARFSSALSVYDFLKFSNVIESSRKRSAAMAVHGEVLAKVEGLYGHAASMALRRRKP